MTITHTTAEAMEYLRHKVEGRLDIEPITVSARVLRAALAGQEMNSRKKYISIALLAWPALVLLDLICYGATGQHFMTPGGEYMLIRILTGTVVAFVAWVLWVDAS